MNFCRVQSDFLQEWHFKDQDKEMDEGHPTP